MWEFVNNYYNNCFTIIEIEDPGYYPAYGGYGKKAHYGKHYGHGRAGYAYFDLANTIQAAVKNKDVIAANLIRINLSCRCVRVGTRDPQNYTIRKCAAKGKHAMGWGKGKGYGYGKCYCPKCKDIVVIIRRLVLRCKCVTTRNFADVDDFNARFGHLKADAYYGPGARGGPGKGHWGHYGKKGYY